MEILLIDTVISRQRLKEIAEAQFGDMVKAVVDVSASVMAIGGELHADEEAFLLERDSKQADLWGINLYPERDLPGMVEFDSLINIRPRQGNRSRGVEDLRVREKIISITRKLVHEG